jgi:hypothetical protein
MPFSKKIEDVIANFRGLPRTVTASSRKPPVPLEELMGLLQEKYKLEQPSPERVIVENWALIFGNKLAGRCNPVRILEGKTLVVSVTNQTLRSELTFMKRSILKKVQQLEHCKEISNLVVRS